MSLFSIKIKTKAGNDIKKRETFTCFFRLNFKRNGITKKVTAEYTYRVMFSQGQADPKCVLEIKNPHMISSIEDLTLKVLLNLCYVVGKLSKDMNVTPDFIIFSSPDLESKKNKSYAYLRDVLKMEKPQAPGTLTTSDFKPDYWRHWDQNQCKQYKIIKNELDLLREFVELNENTVFLAYDPHKDEKKYAKGIKVCEQLQERIDRQITSEEVAVIK